MKKVILTAAAVFTFVLANAQDVKFGIKGGLNLSTIKATLPAVGGSISANPDNKMLVGFNVGGFAEIGISDKFAFQPEVLFSMEGTKFEQSQSGSFNNGSDLITFSDKYTSTIRTSYINVPLLMKFKATEDLFFLAGPQFGFLIGAKQDFVDTETETNTSTQVTTVDKVSKDGVDVKDTFKSLSYALALGAGYSFTDNLFAEVRYNLGLSNDAESVTQNFGGIPFTYQPVYKSNTLQVSLGYRF